MELSFWRDCVF